MFFYHKSETNHQGALSFSFFFFCFCFWQVLVFEDYLPVNLFPDVSLFCYCENGKTEKFNIPS